MSRYNKILSQRVTKIEHGLAMVQQARDPSPLSIVEDLLAEGDRVLHPSMWDWVLESTEPHQHQDKISKIASWLAAGHGWELQGGSWREAPQYWWALKGCAFSYGELNTDGLFYFFQCSRADFDALPEKVRQDAWAEAVQRLTTLLKGQDASTFGKYEPDGARSLVTALSKCHLPRLLKPYLSSSTHSTKGSKEAFEAWIVAEHARQLAKRGILQ